MPEYAPGTPSWVELSSPDTDASAAFYGALMGWDATEPGSVEETGGYRMFPRGGGAGGGGRGHMEGGQPGVWPPYISVPGGDGVAGRVRERGGWVMVPPMDVMEIGRMGFF